MASIKGIKAVLFDDAGETVHEFEVEAWTVENEPNGGIYLGFPFLDLDAGIQLTDEQLASAGYTQQEQD